MPGSIVAVYQYQLLAFTVFRVDYQWTLQVGGHPERIATDRNDRTGDRLGQVFDVEDRELLFAHRYFVIREKDQRVANHKGQVGVFH